MTIPMAFQHTSNKFEAFLHDAREASGITTWDQTYTMVQAVLQTFRHHLDVREAIVFAGVLPPVLRALFITDRNLEQPKKVFKSRMDLAREVHLRRLEQNFSPETPTQDVDVALGRRVDEAASSRVLDQLPTGAIGFWAGP